MREEDEEERSEDPGQVIKGIRNGVLLLYAFGCFSFYWLFLGIFSSESPAFLNLAIPPLVALVLPIFLLFHLGKRGGLSGVLLFVPRPLPSVLVAGMVVAIYFPLAALSSLTESIYPAGENYLEYIAAFKPQGTVDFLGKAIALGAIVPLAEEMLFRGLAQQTFHYWMSPRRAIALAAACFAVAHGAPWLVPPVFILGVFFGYLFARTENLAYPIIAHGVYNLISLVQLVQTPREEILEYVPGVESWILPAAGLVVFVIVLQVFNRVPDFRREE